MGNFQNKEKEGFVPIDIDFYQNRRIFFFLQKQLTNETKFQS